MSGTPSWDMFIILFFIALSAYGFLLQRDKAVVTMIAIYVGLVLATILVDPVQSFFSGEKAFMNQIFIRSNTNTFTIQIVVFLATIGLISTKSGIEGRSSGGSMLELVGFSVLNAALIISSILLFMDPAKRETIMAVSKLGKILVTYNTWLLILPIVFLVGTGWNKESS